MLPQFFPFTQWDVFTAEPLSGNALAIFPDARGLNTDAMQKLARETNLSETAFVCPRDEETERDRGVLVRIFTPEKELPFAGHPTLGTAAMLHARGRRSPIVLEMKAGRIEVAFDEHGTSGVFGEMRQREPQLLGDFDPEHTASQLGLSLQDLAPAFPVQVISTGLPYLIVPIRSLESINRLQVDWRTASTFLETLPGGPSPYFVTTQTTDSRVRLHARCIDPEREDAATGSAAGCAAAWMVMHGIAAPDEQVEIEQGIEIARPSRIFVRAAEHGGQATNVRVGGYAVEVLRGDYIWRKVA